VQIQPRVGRRPESNGDSCALPQTCKCGHHSTKRARTAGHTKKAVSTCLSASLLIPSVVRHTFSHPKQRCLCIQCWMLPQRAPRLQSHPGRLKHSSLPDLAFCVAGRGLVSARNEAFQGQLQLASQGCRTHSRAGALEEGTGRPGAGALSLLQCA